MERGDFWKKIAFCRPHGLASSPDHLLRVCWWFLLRMPFQWRNFCAIFPNKSDKYMAFCIRLVNTLAIVSSSVDDDFHLATPQIANYIDFLPSQNRVSRNWTSGQCFYTKITLGDALVFFALSSILLFTFYSLWYTNQAAFYSTNIYTHRDLREPEPLMINYNW